MSLLPALLASASVRAKAREPSRPLEGAGLAGASQTPEKLLAWSRLRGATGAPWQRAQGFGRFLFGVVPALRP